MQDGVALIPLSLYFKDSRVKVELGLCKGKKLHDKRDSEADRECQARYRQSNEREELLMSNPIVTFEMEDGAVMKAELYPEVAPNTVNNFISLVKERLL